MRITIKEDQQTNHYEMIVTVHPKNKRIAILVINKMTDTIQNIIACDEYKNRYPIPIVSIYYIEIIDQKVFVYTEDEVYRLYRKITEVKEELRQHGFYQINVRTVVNSEHVQKYAYKKDCHREIYMDNGEVLISNRHFKKECDEMIREKNITLMRSKE